MVVEEGRFYKLRDIAGEKGIGLSYDCLRKMCVTGQLRHVRAGTKYLVSGNVILELLGGDIG